MNPAEYFRRAYETREAWEAAGVSPHRLAILSSYTMDFLTPYIIVESEKIGFPVVPWIGPFNILEQLALEDKSPLWRENPDVIWLALGIEAAAPDITYEFPKIGPEKAAMRLNTICERLVNLSRAIRSRSSAAILVSNLCLTISRIANIFDASDPDGLGYVLAEANREMARALAEIPDAHVFDHAGVVSELGSSKWSDPRLWYRAKACVASENQAFFSRRIVRSLAALLRPPAKCLVLDLDNTLWGGVLGDDGPEGIQIGDDYPGNIYKDFQRFLLGMRHRGFLLAVASNNDESLVSQTLATHPEMVLRPEHFAEIRANWQPKIAKLQSIADSLNLGLDSLVFVDDNPLERAQVRDALPAVSIVELPQDPLRYAEALVDLPVLDRPRLLAEDRERPMMYQQDKMRRVIRQSAETVQSFLRDLQMVATVGPCDTANLNRVAQLIQKTNQFNLTARRHKLEDVRQSMVSDEAEVCWLRLEDRFGDMGLVCVGILRVIDRIEWEIDTFLMSCRVMGRGVEDAFLAYLVEVAARGGVKRVRGVYRPTPRNHIVEAFYPERGFQEITAKEEGLRVFQRDLHHTFPWPETIKRVDYDGVLKT